MESVEPTVNLSTLAEHPELVDQLAEWHHETWGQLYGDLWTLADAHKELRAQTVSYPVTLIALHPSNGELMGSVSAIDEDVPGFDDLYSPWLASLFVRPEFRRSGIGRMLVAALEAHMAGLGYSRLHLVTPHHRAWYEPLGWTTVGRLPLGTEHLDLMFKDLANPAT
jgi:GNAT superfamily N-acetyltransferase